MKQRTLLSLVSLAFLVACGAQSATTGVVRTPVASQPIEDPVVGENEPTQIKVQVIVVGFRGADESTSTRDEDNARRRADTIAGLARTRGANFRELATQYSDAPNFELSPRRGSRVIPEESEDTAWRLRVGEVSTPLRTARGFYIFKRRPDPQQGPTEVGVRHILIAFAGASRASEEITRTEDEAHERAEEVVALVNAEGANWDQICGEYSDGPTGPTGGDLGVVSRGQMVRAFERAAFALELNQTSEVVRSPFGFHVVRRYQ